MPSDAAADAPNSAQSDGTINKPLGTAGLAHKSRPNVKIVVGHGNPNVGASGKMCPYIAVAIGYAMTAYTIAAPPIQPATSLRSCSVSDPRLTPNHQSSAPCAIPKEREVVRKRHPQPQKRQNRARDAIVRSAGQRRDVHGETREREEYELHGPHGEVVFAKDCEESIHGERHVRSVPRRRECPVNAVRSYEPSRSRRPSSSTIATPSCSALLSLLPASLPATT